MNQIIIAPLSKVCMFLRIVMISQFAGVLQSSNPCGESPLTSTSMTKHAILLIMKQPNAHLNNMAFSLPNSCCSHNYLCDRARSSSNVCGRHTHTSVTWPVALLMDAEFNEGILIWRPYKTFHIHTYFPIILSVFLCITTLTLMNRVTSGIWQSM